MSIQITIGSTIIEFPSAAQNPSWAPALIEFAKAVEESLQSVAGPFDVPTQYLTIDAYNPGSNISMPSFTFPTSDVRGAQLIYAINRTTDSQELTEFGSIDINYNASRPIGNKWEMVRESAGDAEVIFTMTDTGQVLLTTTAIAGSNHQGVISYQAKALLQDI